MNEITTINGQELAEKEFNGKRVVTFKDIDTVHQRAIGTARNRFNDNKQYFIEGEDYFKVCADEIRTHKIFDISPKAHEDIILVTESGYLMIAKSLTDKLAWQVQRQLVNSYFRAKQEQTSFSDLSPQLQLLISLETKQREQEKAIEDANRRIDNIGEVVALDVHSWRKDAQRLVTKIASQLGGVEHTKDVYNEIYRLIEERAGVSLSTRLTNKRRRMADEGVCKSKRGKLNNIDIIADDKKLIEIYIAIVKEMAVKNGVC